MRWLKPSLIDTAPLPMIHSASEYHAVGSLPTRMERLVCSTELSVWDESQIFDRFSQKEQTAFVQTFCRLTGLPNLFEFSRRMEREILRLCQKLEQEYETKVLFFGYDRFSSVRQGKALPGSDVDGWYMIVDDAHGITADQMVAYLKSQCNRALLRTSLLGDSIHEVYTRLWTLQEVRARILGEPGAHAMQGWGVKSDSDRDKLIDIILAGRHLRSELPQDVVEKVEKVYLSNPQDPFGQRALSIQGLTDKPKHLARKVFTEFPSLALDEQFLVCRLLRTKDYYGASDPVMHLDQRSPYYASLRNLIARRWVTPYENSVGVPWHVDYTYFPDTGGRVRRFSSPADLVAHVGDIYSDNNVEQWSFSHLTEPTHPGVRHFLGQWGTEAIRKGFYDFFGLARNSDI